MEHLETLTDDEEDHNSIFTKTLPSDYDEATCLNMLFFLHHKHGSKGWDGFTLGEMKHLSDGLTILQFERNETFMRKGEVATFVAIILSGDIPLFREILEACESMSRFPFKFVICLQAPSRLMSRLIYKSP